jgi:hypothetical protein
LEYPEHVKRRLEEAKKKSKKPRDDSLSENEDFEDERFALPKHIVSLEFPDLPKFDLTILKKEREGVRNKE